MSPISPVPRTLEFPLDASNVGEEISTVFFHRQSVRDTWIALWVMWLLWAMLFVTKLALGPPRMVDSVPSERAVTASGAVAPAPGTYVATEPVGVEPVNTAGVPTPAVAPRQSKPRLARTGDNIRERMDRTHNLVRDLTLMLLLVVTLNTFGLGSGVTVLVLSWIYVGFAFLWAALMVTVDHRVIDVIFGVLETLLILAMLITAYAIGWSVF
ncbi:hypothetical protein EDD21DRAFT_373775 [Dissophora ornata]|nr:hypothetical protein EDD21DRAFT_373775 [Dissophora ornata]